MGWGCCWSWLVRPGDTPDEARIKTLMFPFAIFTFPVLVFDVFVTLQNDHQTIIVIGESTAAFAAILFMVGVVSNAIPAGYLLDVSVLLITVGLSALDLGEATMSYTFRAWAGVVLVLDCALLFKRYHMPRFIIPIVL
eukprot:Hpha_TRINITY_DN16395_c1_g2::TRINITY_DN16395_c1_g2_i3::g.60512::m.60512